MEIKTKVRGGPLSRPFSLLICQQFIKDIKIQDNLPEAEIIGSGVEIPGMIWVSELGEAFETPPKLGQVMPVYLASPFFLALRFASMKMVY